MVKATWISTAMGTRYSLDGRERYGSSPMIAIDTSGPASVGVLATRIKAVSSGVGNHGQPLTTPKLLLLDAWQADEAGRMAEALWLQKVEAEQGRIDWTWVIPRGDKPKDEQCPSLAYLKAKVRGKKIDGADYLDGKTVATRLALSEDKGEILDTLFPANHQLNAQTMALWRDPRAHAPLPRCVELLCRKLMQGEGFSRYWA